MAQSPLDILNAAGIESLGRGQSGQQQPMQQAPQGGLPPVKPSTSQTKSILENEIARLTGEEDDLGSLKQLADERKKEREKLQKFYEEFQPSDSEKFLAIGQGLGQRVPRGGGQSAIAASVANAAGLVAPVVSKNEQLKQAYRLKAMEMGYAAADEAYKESMTQKRDIQKLLMQEEIRAKMGDAGTLQKEIDTMSRAFNIYPGDPQYPALVDMARNQLRGSVQGKNLASGPLAVELATNPQYIQEKKAVEDRFDNASTRAAYGPNGAEQWQADRQAAIDAVTQRYTKLNQGASNLVPGAPRSEPSAPGIIPPPSPMNQAPSASNVVPGAEGQAPKAEPVSVRNNNPLNLVDTKTGSIKTFGSPEEGATAGFNDLVSKLKGSSEAYKRRFGDAPITPERLAEVWSPALGKGNSAASTANYAKAIASAAGISTSDTINPTPETIKKIYQAMATFEAGAPSTPATAPSATVQAATATAPAPSVAPALASAAKPGARGFITPAEEATAKVVAEAQGKADALLIPGSPEYIKLKDAQSKDNEILQRLEETSINVMGDINKLIDIKVDPRTGKEMYKLKPGLAASVGSMEGTGWVGGVKGFFNQDIANRKAYIEGLKNKLSVSGLEELRKAGNAPGSITEKEWPLFQQALSTLKETLDPQEYASQLIKVKKAFENLQAKAKINYAKKYENIGAKPDTDATDILGIRKPK